MSRMKSIFAVLVIAAIVGIVPMAHAVTPTFPVVMAGSSALWQTLALGAYNNNHGASTSTAIAVPPMFHWTSNGAQPGLNLRDCRNQLAGATLCNDDAATVWVVWDSASTPHVWVNAKVDSVVGDRCFFAKPACLVVDTAGSNATWTAPGSNKISSTLWGDSSSDTTLPGPVLAIVENSGLDIVNVAATDIRPEDAEWAIARVNSAAGSSTTGGTASDGTDGLGYNSNNASPGSNEFPGTKTGSTCNHISNTQGIGTPIFSAKGHTGTSTDAANVLAFNISGNDPYSCTAVGAYTVKSVGAAPIVFVASRQGHLANLTYATEQELQQVFSGTNVNANAFKTNNLSAGAINAYLREPLSGTYNTTEATVMRYPTRYPNPVAGLSQELNTIVSGTLQNPLNCQVGTTASGGGCRYRGIGTGEVVAMVLNSNSGTGQSNITTQDGIAYAFFSYGNVGSLADNAGGVNYGYIQLNGVDPIFASYNAGNTIDPGQPNGVAPGTVPGAADVPGGAFPKCENAIWGNGFSFPNLRNGTYRSWSSLRLIYASTQSTPITDLVTASNKYVVTTVPDYVPATAVTIAANQGCGVAALPDLGLKLLRSHYQQKNGEGHTLAQACTVGGGSATVTGCKAVANVVEFGGDMGGMIIPTTIGVLTENQKQMVQSSDTNGGLGPALRP